MLEDARIQILPHESSMLILQQSCKIILFQGNPSLLCYQKPYEEKKDKKKIISPASFPLVGKISIMKHATQEGNIANVSSHIAACLGHDELMNAMLTNCTCCKSIMNKCVGSHA